MNTNPTSHSTRTAPRGVPTLPQTFSNSALSTYKTCQWKYFVRYILGIKDQPTEAMLKGGAFAEGLKAARIAHATGATPDQAHAEGAKAILTHFTSNKIAELPADALGVALQGFYAYLTQYPLDTDPARTYVSNEAPHIEFSFAIPLHPGLNHPSGDPILYTGRYDRNVTWAGSILSCDEKTTKQLGPSFEKKYQNSSQLLGYTWAGRSMGVPLKGAMIRGISLQKTQNKFATPVYYHTEAQVELWYEETCDLVAEIIEKWGQSSCESLTKTPAADALARSPYFRRHYDWLCTLGGTCSYMDPCADGPLTAEGLSRLTNPPTSGQNLDLANLLQGKLK